MKTKLFGRNKPDFLQNVEYVWLEDKDGWWKNAFNKTMKAIESGISDKFLLMAQIIEPSLLPPVYFDTFSYLALMLLPIK